MNKLSSPDAKVKQQHTWLSSKLDTATSVAVPFIPPDLNLRFNGINFDD
jgi:hypothetical protein